MENSQNAQIETINQLNAYQRDVFLNYFRVSKKNSLVNEAMSRRNPELLDSLRQELEIDAQESIKQLQLTPDFNGYSEYRDAAIQIAEFFIDQFVIFVDC